MARATEPIVADISGGHDGEFDIEAKAKCGLEQTSLTVVVVIEGIHDDDWVDRPPARQESVRHVRSPAGGTSLRSRDRTAASTIRQGRGSRTVTAARATSGN